jgi:hypothetical protein
MQTRRGFTTGTGLAAAALATAVTYYIRAVHPWPHTPLDAFLGAFRRRCARAGKESAVAWEATVAGQSATIAEAAAAIRTAEPVIAIVARSRRSSDFRPPFGLVWPERTGAGCTTASRTTT